MAFAVGYIGRVRLDGSGLIISKWVRDTGSKSVMDRFRIGETVQREAWSWDDFLGPGVSVICCGKVDHYHVEQALRSAIIRRRELPFVGRPKITG